jgi:VanZ family protein
MPASSESARFIRLLPAIAWMLAIFAFSSFPGSDIPGTVVWLSPLAHFLEYAVLAALLVFATGRRGLTVPLALTLLLACSLYGVSDEIHQAFTPGRTPDPIDWAVDTAGAAGALTAIALARRRRA